MMDPDWLPLTELTLQGNLTIAGFAQKTWTAKRGVCEIYLHAKSGMARIDWNHSSVVVSSAVIQHGTLNVVAEHENKVQADYERAQGHMQESMTDDERIAHAVKNGTEKIGALVQQSASSRADQILAEFEQPESVTVRRTRRKKAD